MERNCLTVKAWLISKLGACQSIEIPFASGQLLN